MAGKTFSERLYLSYKNYNLNVRIARFHNIFGPGELGGGKKKRLQLCVEKLLKPMMNQK